MLVQRRGNSARTELVFPAPNGGYMSDRNFRNRAWKRVLSDCGVPYRRPYIMRSTFISHCSAMGWSPAYIADITGHDPEILIRHYLGGIQGRKKVPEMPYTSNNMSEMRETIESFERRGKDWSSLN